MGGIIKLRCFHLLDIVLEKIENILVILILTVMILLAFTQVILRNFFSTSIFWGDIFLRHMVLWIGFIGASLATREGRHINIDALSRLLSHHTKLLSQTIVNLFSAVVSFFLMQAAIGFIGMEKDSGTVVFSSIPTWFAQT